MNSARIFQSKNVFSIQFFSAGEFDSKKLSGRNFLYFFFSHDSTVKFRLKNYDTISGGKIFSRDILNAN